MSLKNKTIIVTGASSGIGAETVKQLVSAGANVVFGSRRLEPLKELADKLPKDQIAFMFIDVTKIDDMKKIVDLAVQKFKKVDALYNNAGIMPLSKLRDDRRDEWKQMLDINVMGVLNGISAVLPVMHKQGFGHILATDSVAGHVVYPDSAVYAGTKFAVRAIMEGLRQEELDNHIRSTIISPGAVQTNLYKTTKDENQAKELVESWKQPNNSLITSDVASAVVFAIDTPQRVAISDIVIRPSEQRV
ncbi:SDR family oxidoreductase [Companilactobacillus pabuli]|jgi:NADP-dependent 3-hydroxy acid dehydrogenase YdfG|uniref:SDR family oxidoreductase n=2 Tax=Companilactobacillus pabuli TaxID=2714036 RepID=A0A7L7KWB5_9LACO|nr:SDR family oxidoreductase [Companilactobacillus pabuli]AKP03933.1 hypothetical protein ABB45_10110 [Companilactobacillus farciminis]AKS52238.1 hypothetical protein ABB44_10130 [Companilactobacillus farciminis]MDG5113181.1 SDR family oxidoreductase [Companilactobacillus pabuli]QMT84005.1 SDR family oxidoreductase [Companilactobacillus pabuli]GAQ00270.1 septum formation initiator [Companilactobacillus farciminis]